MLAPTMALDDHGADREVGQVHLPPLAADAAGRLAPDLRRDRLERRPLGEQVSDRPMGAENHVVDAQRRADADRDRLLALALVQRARDQPLQEQLVEVFLVTADQ